MVIIELYKLILRILVVIITLIIMIRIKGPKQLTQMCFYDYIVGITVGSIAATVSINKNISLFNGVIAIVVFLFAGIIMSWLTNKSMPIRRILTGVPITLIKQGEIQWNGLKKARMNINELLSNLRNSGYFDINDVYNAILEPIGKLSVEPKASARQPKIRDLNIPVPKTTATVSVVIDGVIMQRGLCDFHKDEQWLRSALKKRGFPDLNKIGLATLSDNGSEI